MSEAALKGSIPLFFCQREAHKYVEYLCVLGAGPLIYLLFFFFGGGGLGKGSVPLRSRPGPQNRGNLKAFSTWNRVTFRVLLYTGFDSEAQGL